jgi:hypothetical protein
MSFSSLLDHTARVWRRAETLGTYAETTVSYTLVYNAIRCTLRRKRAVLSEAGPGTVDVGERTVYFLPAVTLEEKDLVELVTGPDAPDWMAVESRAKPRGHHIEARCVEYHGPTPEMQS